MRLRRERPESTPLSVTAILVTSLTALGIAAGLMYVALVAPRGVPGVSYYELNATFDDRADVSTGSEVRIAGRRVGQVTGTTLGGGGPVLRLQLLAGNGPLRSDTRARIRSKGILGGRYVELEPGRRGRSLPAGGSLPASQTASGQELLDVIQALDARSRQALQRTLRGLGQGVLGRGDDIGTTLGEAAPLFDDMRRVSDAVLAHDGAAARLAPSAESAAAALDPAREDLASGLRPEARVVQTLAERRTDLQATLEEAPRSLAALRGGLDAATPLLRETEGLARAAVRLTRPAPAALRSTAVLLREARPALAVTEPLLHRLEQAVPPTLDLLERVAPVSAPTVRALVNALPPLAELGRRPCDLHAWSRNWRSMLGYGVAGGTGDPSGDLDDDVGLGLLTSLRIVASVAGDALGLDATPVVPSSNAYPAPCMASEERGR